MYDEEIACFDPTMSELAETPPIFNATETVVGMTTKKFCGGVSDDGTDIYTRNSIEIELQKQLELDIDPQNHNNNLLLIQQQQQEMMMINNHDPNQMEFSYTDHQSNWNQQNALLNLFYYPENSVLPNDDFNSQQQNQTAMNFLNGNGAENGLMYDPLYHLNNLPPQPPLFRDMFQNLPQNYGFSGPFFGEESNGGIVYQNGGGESGVLEFTGGGLRGRGRGRNGKRFKHFTTERQRRQHLNDKFETLKNLVPNPTKQDRASIVGDGIEYINELIRTVNELKVLVEKKRCSKEKRKRSKTEEENGEESSRPNGGGDSSADQYYNGSMRSSWLQRKSKDTEVDVRIIDDDVTIKLVQRKKINCLLLVSKFLDELNLDLQHVAGGHIGDFHSFLFNSKIYEGSSLYASAIANKLIDVVDRHYNAASILPTTNNF